MILYHSEITINVGQIIKSQCLNENLECEDIILNYRWTEIELIPDFS
jgi:hypothetical protein